MRISHCTMCAVVCLLAGKMAVSSDRDILPTSAPIPITPSGTAERKVGYGFNLVSLKAEWKEDLLTANTEHIGEIEYESRNIVVGIQKKKDRNTAIEYDFLAGMLKSKSAQDSYLSPTLGKTADLDMTGDGWDVGARIIYSRCFHEQKYTDGSMFIEWIAGLSLHAAVFSSDEHYFAETQDRTTMTDYDETITGIFFRPAAALQPIIHVSDRLKLNPYVGVDARLTAYASDWEETDGRWAGLTWEQIKAYGYDPTGSDIIANLSLGKALIGMDIGIVINRKLGHELRVGAAMSKLLGGSSGDFSEAHVLYSMEM